MTVDPATLKALIEQEMSHVSDQRIVANIRALLVEPVVVMRGWDYGEPGLQYPCWSVLDDSAHSDTAIAYCEFGFGPGSPWGLVWTGNDPGAERMSMGMDSGWFSTFLDAYFDSFASTSVPIWQVFKIASEAREPATAVTGELEWNLAWKQCEDLRKIDPKSNYVVRYPIGTITTGE